MTDFHGLNFINLCNNVYSVHISCIIIKRNIKDFEIEDWIFNYPNIYF